jgi:hypothetical protein
MPYVDKMFDVFNKSYASLSSFAITDIQKNISRKIHRINQSGYIKFVEDKTTILLLSVLLFLFQSFTKKLFPLFHLLKAKNKVKMSFSI